ncbi:fimbrillin family protein [Bacteroides sp. UBA939]|uniref:fimbrillin family protein n=1 Tax=Bacteroides sp. UBA939 TaxID=1946092 RepID=UPI0025C714C3|nr:fimbrillin family protein [Bacteroides sp. UBA939]
MKISDTHTRATDTAFEKGDKVGLFATFSSKSISEERYIDNLKLEYGSNSSFIPEKIVFYPVGDATLDFTGYYPYQTTKIPANVSTVPISVQTDQSTTARRSQSDFLVAKASNIVSSENPVELEFHHKLFKMQITLTPKEGENINDLLKANPHIIATGFRTKANYNLDTDKITDTHEEADIIPHGAWSIKDGKLVGKEIIIIPQTVNPESQSLVMDWNGQIYTCPMPDLTIEGGTQCELDVTAMQTTNHILTGVIGAVFDWKTIEGKEIDNNGKTTSVHLLALSFSQSDIYRIYSGGRPIAEICKEYLKSENINSRAITIYPVDNEQSDLSKGTVLKLLDDERDINGGIISWNTTDNTFTYTSGSSKPVEVFYLNEAGEVLTEKPESSINISIIGHVIRDIRDGSVKEYPIVKIGTQYWMKDNLQATTYRDGTALAKQTELEQGSGYFQPAGQNTYFYNGDALLANELAPEQWRIANLADWNLLVEYIADTALLLKAGQWRTGETTYTGTGETGFNAIAYGLYNNKNGTALVNVDASASYWISGNSALTLADKAVLLMGHDTTVRFVDITPGSSALSVRCIKE